MHAAEPVEDRADTAVAPGGGPRAGGYQARSRSDGPAADSGVRTLTESCPGPEQRWYGKHHDVYGPEGPWWS